MNLHYNQGDYNSNSRKNALGQEFQIITIAKSFRLSFIKVLLITRTSNYHFIFIFQSSCLCDSWQYTKTTHDEHLHIKSVTSTLMTERGLTIQNLQFWALPCLLSKYFQALYPCGWLFWHGSSVGHWPAA